MRTRLWLAAVLVAGAALVPSAARMPDASARTAFTATAIAADAIGTATPLAGFQIQSTSVTGDSGATVSQPGYAASGWYPATRLFRQREPETILVGTRCHVADE